MNFVFFLKSGLLFNIFYCFCMFVNKYQIENAIKMYNFLHVIFYVKTKISVDFHVYVNSFFPGTARLWNYLPTECFPLTYNLNDLKSRIDRHLLAARSFLIRFPVCLNLFSFLFLVTPCLVVAVQSCMELSPIKKIKGKSKRTFNQDIKVQITTKGIKKEDRPCMKS